MCPVGRMVLPLLYIIMYKDYRPQKNGTKIRRFCTMYQGNGDIFLDMQQKYFNFNSSLSVFMCLELWVCLFCVKKLKSKGDVFILRQFLLILRHIAYYIVNIINVYCLWL